MRFDPTASQACPPSIFRRLFCPLSLAAALGVSACGGGGDSPTIDTLPPPIASTAVLTGTASAGNAWGGAGVSVSDGAGRSACQEASLVTSALGTYLCTLTSATAPYFVVVTDPQGASAPLVSVLATTPAAASTTVLNATTLTTAISAALAPDLNPLTLVASHRVNAGALQTLTANVVAQLANVLNALGLASGFNPFSTPIVAATASSTGNAADQLLDLVHVVSDPASAGLALATVDNPTPVPLATASGAGAVLVVPLASAATLPLAAQIEAQAINACFELPLDQRVLTSDAAIALQNGGPSVTAMAPACAAIAATAASGAGIDFRQSGYTFGQYFYSLLTASSMTGAAFGVPEVMAVFPATASASGKDEAVLNFKYVDTAGYPGNIIAVARHLPNSATASHGSDWWLTGDQESVDMNIRVLVRKVEQRNAASATFSHFRNGLQFLFNAKGPGSVNGAGTMNYARVTGPGLPSAGLVFIAPVPAEVGQVQMDIVNANGVIGGTTLCFNCPNYWFSYTAGLTGNDARTLTNRFAGLNSAPFGTNLSGVVKGAKYRIELFYGTQTTASRVVDKVLLSPLVPATQAINQAWNDMGPATMAALDPANAALNGMLPSVTVDWLQNASAQQIASVNVSVSTTGTYATAARVPRGATSITVTPTPSVPALTTATNREFLLHYRTLDNSDKNSEYRWN